MSYNDLSSATMDLWAGIPYPSWSYDLEMAELFNGDDTLIGSKHGYSIHAWLHDGNDYLELHSGLDNWVNTNKGTDKINIYSSFAGYDSQPGGRVHAGKDNDEINIMGGWFAGDRVTDGFVNGNMGDDVISNWSPLAGNVRGGKGNDRIINYKGYMNAYGDMGSDTFTPYYSHSWEDKSWMIIKDFQRYYDVLDTSALGSGSSQVITEDGLNIYADGSYGTQLVATLEGIYDYLVPAS